MNSRPFAIAFALYFLLMLAFGLGIVTGFFGTYYLPSAAVDLLFPEVPVTTTALWLGILYRASTLLIGAVFLAILYRRMSLQKSIEDLMLGQLTYTNFTRRYLLNFWAFGFCASLTLCTIEVIVGTLNQFP